MIPANQLQHGLLHRCQSRHPLIATNTGPRGPDSEGCRYSRFSAGPGCMVTKVLVSCRGEAEIYALQGSMEELCIGRNVIVMLTDNVRILCTTSCVCITQ